MSQRFFGKCFFIISRIFFQGSDAHSASLETGTSLISPEVSRERSSDHKQCPPDWNCLGACRSPSTDWHPVSFACLRHITNTQTGKCAQDKVREALECLLRGSWGWRTPPLTQEMGKATRMQLGSSQTLWASGGLRKAGGELKTSCSGVVVKCPGSASNLSSSPLPACGWWGDRSLHLDLFVCWRM